MTYLNPALIARLRSSVQKGFLNDTCKIEVAGMTTGDLGQPIETWTLLTDNAGTDYSKLACRLISPYPSATQVSGGQETMTEQPRLVCSAGAALDKQQRATIASTGHVYDIAGVVSDLTDHLFVSATVVRRR